MRERQQSLAELATREMGKLIAQSAGEVALSAAIIDYYADHAEAFLAPEPLKTDNGHAVVESSPIGVLFGVEQYISNRVTVLGRVQNPGLLSFDHPPTLLEALAKAGSLPVIDKQATLTRCAIFRGREKMIWVDLKRLLNGGQVNLNLRLKPGDLVYIPDSSDTMVYVLGAVHRPGAYRLTPDMSVMDALATAGGPNDDAQPRDIGIYRPARQAVERIALQNLMDARRHVNFALEEGDVIFVPKSGIAEFGYVSRQIAAGLSLMTFGAAVGK